MSKRVWTWLRVIATLCLLGLAFHLVDLQSLASAAAEVSIPWLFLGIALFFVIVLFEAVQFAFVAEEFGHNLSWPEAFKVTCVGRFFAVFTPAMVGCDIYRAASLYGRGGGVRTAISVAAIARLLSLAALVIVLLAGLPFLFGYLGTSPAFLAFLSVILVATLATAFLLFFHAPETAVPGFVARSKVGAELLGGAAGLRRAAFGSEQSRGIWFCAVMQHLLRVLAVAAIGVAFGINASLWVYFAFVPVSLLIAMVPISVGSWGVREVALVYSLGLVGISATSALLVSVTLGLIGMLLAVFGALLWMVKGEGTSGLTDKAS